MGKKRGGGNRHSMDNIPGGWDVLQALGGTTDPGVQMVRLEAIRLDERMQPRAAVNWETVEEYAEAMQNGAEFPPVDLIQDEDGALWPYDGWHRYLAAKQIGRPAIEAKIEPGSVRDAILKAMGANAKHGLRRTNEDKRRAVMALLLDDEWAKWSDRKIARACGVSNRFVSNLRQDATVNGSHIRRVERGGAQEYEMDTSGLSRADRRVKRFHQFARKIENVRKWKLTIDPAEMEPQQKSALREEIRAAREHLAQLEDALGDE